MRTRRIELSNAFEADVLDGILTDEGIPHTVVSNATMAYNGLFQLGMGWGFMEVPEENAEKVLKLFQDFKQSLNASQSSGLSNANGVMMETGPASGRQPIDDGRREDGWPVGTAAAGPDDEAPVQQSAAFAIEEVNAMFDQDLIQSVMTQTGADRETASAALKTSDGNADIAVRIIRSYTLRDDAMPGGETAERGTYESAGSSGAGTGGGYGTASGYGAERAYGEETDSNVGADRAEGSEGAGTGSGAGGQGAYGSTGQTGGKKGSYNIPKAQDIIDSIKEIWKRGNASSLDIEKDGRVILSLPLTVSTIGLALAPVAALIGLGAALVTQFTIKITLDNGTVINVNEFAVTHRHTTETRGANEPKDDE